MLSEGPGSRAPAHSGPAWPCGRRGSGQGRRTAPQSVPGQNPAFRGYGLIAQVGKPGPSEVFVVERQVPARIP